LRSAIEKEQWFPKSRNPFKPGKRQVARPLPKHAQENGNCGQWHGRAETYITRNHLGGVTLGVSPTKQERVACSATSCKQGNKPKACALP